MADFDELKERIIERIRTNGTGEITGQVMQDTLLDMVDTMGEEIGGVIEGATAAVDSYVGTPSASVTLQNKILNFLFRNLKGEQGDSAVFDPNTGNILASLHNTTGYDDANAMTQKAVTEELMYNDEEIDLSQYSVINNTYINAANNWWRTDGTGGNNACLIIPIEPYTRIKAIGLDKGDGTRYTPQVVFLTSNTYSNKAPVQYAGDEQTYPTWSNEDEGEVKVAPYNTAYMYVRTKTSGTNIKPTLYKVASVKEKVEDINEEVVALSNGIEEISEQLSIPTYKYGQISSSGYDWTFNGNKVSNELEFDPTQVRDVRITLLESGAQYTVYTIVGSTITNMLSGYTVNDLSFTPVNGTKYVIRFRAVAGATKEYIDALPESAYPCVEVTYTSPSIVIEETKSRISALEPRSYTYSRRYSNITGLLTFENKAISAQGIVDSNSSLLAKIPSIGCVEVKMNKPIGGYSVWKKTGNSIVCVQNYTHYQYRYTGDYESEYYVMLQAEAGETLTEAIATIYTYSDEGKTYNYTPPTWAAGKKVAFLGDSIVQGRYPKNGASSVNICMDKPWTNLVAETLGTEDYMDFAIGGATVYDSDWKSLQRNASLITGYDVVFVCGGTNDYGNKVSKANFESAYENMLTTLVANNVKVIAMTPVYRTKTITNPSMAFVSYIQSVIDIASSLDVALINTYTLTNTSSFSNTLVDGLHPNEIGQMMIANIVLEEIKKI